MMHGQKNIKI